MLQLLQSLTCRKAATMGLSLVRCRGRVAQSEKKKNSLLKELRKQSRFLWGLDDDIKGYHALMASDPHLASLHAQFGALSIVRAPDMYEALLVAVLGQQISVHAAQAVRRRLMQNMGTRITVATTFGKEHYHLYPATAAVDRGRRVGVARTGCIETEAFYLLQIAKCGRGG